MQRAGSNVVAGFDAEPKCAPVYERLTGHALTVADLKGETPAIGDGNVDVDLLWASPPCQPWSTAGKRLGADDPRDCVMDAVRHALEIGPRWFVMENVPGAARGPVLDALWASRQFGFVGHGVIDCADIGLPQRRKRLIVLAGPQDIPSLWAPTHGPGQSRPWVGSGEVLGARVFGGGTNPHGKGRAHERTLRELTDEPATTIPASHAGNNSVYIAASGLTRDGLPGASTRPRMMTEPASTVTGKGTQQLVTTDGETWHRVRTLTVPERAALQGLPFVEGMTGRMVGNAVPPLLAEHIGRKIKEGT